MQLSPEEARRRLRAARVARLATVGADGAPHLVPVTFVLYGDGGDGADGGEGGRPGVGDGPGRAAGGCGSGSGGGTGAADRFAFAVDHKPKRHRDLRRLRNIAAEPRVSVLVDAYDEDWTRLWWVRADGRAHVAEGAEAEGALDLLAAKYPPYGERRPEGPVVVVVLARIAGWSAADG